VILTVTLNLAVDVTYHVERIRWQETSRVDDVARRAGGKGVNVARVLHQLGHEAVVTGLAGGVTGAAARAELADAGLEDQTVPMEGTSRTTLVVVEADGGVTGFSEPGPQVSAAEFQRLLQRFQSLLPRVDAVVLAGSLPPGVPVDAYARLVAGAVAAGRPVLLDAEGEALTHGVAAGPTLVKLNTHELAGVLAGRDSAAGAEMLRAAGAEAVVVSEGARGLVAVTPDGSWRAAPPSELRGNPTGAGDAASAALILGAMCRSPWPERLADAVALSAAAVRAPQAGSFDLVSYRSPGEIVVSGLPG
jgi:tagatose 6-phosphate kinase